MIFNALAVGYQNGISCFQIVNFVKVDGSTKNNTLFKGEALNYPVKESFIDFNQLKLLAWGNQGNLNGIVIINDIAQFGLEANLIFPFINKLKLDMIRQQMVIATIEGT